MVKRKNTKTLTENYSAKLYVPIILLVVWSILCTILYRNGTISHIRAVYLFLLPALLMIVFAVYAYLQPKKLPAASMTLTGLALSFVLTTLFVFIFLGIIY